MSEPARIGDATLYLGDCLDVLRSMPAESVHAVVTDPPAGIAFMGKAWDRDKGGRAQWVAWMTEVAAECLRVLKPGGHALVWAIPRTSHWTATAWEDAGFDVRDRVSWVQGQGFPKSLDVSKALDKKAGAVRVVTGPNRFDGVNGKANLHTYGTASLPPETAPATEAASQWSGWGTALKPAVEDWWLLRKPLIGTVADNVLAHGCGGLNVDWCRVGVDGRRPLRASDRRNGNGVYRDGLQGSKATGSTDIGRFPPNLTHDGSPEVLGLFPDTKSGKMRAGQQRKASKGRGGYHGGFPDGATEKDTPGDSGSSARFYPSLGYGPEDADSLLYCPKASRKDRGEGNRHPTVKPQKLMRWLVRLVTPPGGTVLDCFSGSGTTGVAALAEGFKPILIDNDPESFDFSCGRIAAAASQPTLDLEPAA